MTVPRPGAPGASTLRLGIALVLAIGAAVGAPPARTTAAPNPVVIENQFAGSGEWIWSMTLANDVDGQIKAYASATSVRQGESITLFVSVSPAQTYTMDVYRIGWYGGWGGRHRLRVGPLDGAPQQPCLPDADGLIACGWTPSHTLAIPGDWTSGLYLVKLQNAAGVGTYAQFVVRDDRPATFLYQQSVTTTQAYNNYPDDGATGKSLYSFNSHGPLTSSGETRAVRVSFDRPYAGYGFGQPDDLNTIRWLERNGYDVTYSTNVDTHRSGQRLLDHQVFLSTTHDEYWSKEMRDNVERARDSGVDLAFLGANAAYWQIRFEPSAAGVADRVIVCYKITPDPVQGPTVTRKFREIGRSEQSLLGIQFASEVVFGQNVPYVVTNAAHWAFRGTGLRNGDTIPGIVGYEMDRVWTTFPAPASAGPVEILSESPYVSKLGVPDVAHSSIYRAPSGALVFASGTISWAWGLDNFSHGMADERIGRITANVFDAFLNGPPVPAVASLRLDAPPAATAGEAFTVTVTALDPQGQAVAGYDGTVRFSTDDTAAGVALPPDARLTNGQGTFPVTLTTARASSVTATDTAQASLTSTAQVVVRPAGASRFVLAGPASAGAGDAFSFTVTARDAFGNTDTAYAGRVRFSSSDTATGVALPPESALAAGTGSFSATLVRAGAQTLSATDAAAPSVSGTLPLDVRPAAAARFELATAATPTAGSPFSFGVTAQDRFGNVATAYPGRVRFASSDTSPGASLPPESTLISGQGTFSAALTRAGAQTITATDAGTAAIAGTLSVTVLPAAAAGVLVDTPPRATASQRFDFTVTLRDRFGNVATGYRGTLRFSSSDPSLLTDLPRDTAFTAADAGTKRLDAILWTPPSQTITATDAVDARIVGTSPPVQLTGAVGPGL